MDEQTLNTIIGIAELILYITLIILAIYFIIFMKNFLKSISKIEKEVVEISNELTPVIKDMKFITDDIKMIVDRSRIHFHKVEDVSETLIDKVGSLVNTINKVQDFGNGFLFNITNLVSAITKGIRSFGNKISNSSELSLKNLN